MSKNFSEIESKISLIEKTLQEIKSLLKSDNEQITIAPITPTIPVLPVSPVQSPVLPVLPVLPVSPVLPVQSPEFEDLKNLLNSKEWPNAIDSDLICNKTSEEDKEDRAEGIIDLIFDIKLKGLSVLDFGCGEGHVAKKLLDNEVRKSVGYDINATESWDKWKENNLLLTKDWNKVVENGPYDSILLYDVLDHVEGNDEVIVEILNKIKSVAKTGTTMFIRCHPFCSRHGTHLYQQINKAFIHLVFNEEEQKQLGLNPIFTRKIIHPMITYKYWFKLANLTLVKKDQIYKEPIEPFFINHPIIAKRIQSNWKESHEESLKSGKKFPSVQTEQCFLDYQIRF